MRNLAILLPLIFLSCSKVDPYCGMHGDCDPQFHPLHLRVENVTNQEFTSIEVRGMNSYQYGPLIAGDTSDYQYVPEGAYRYSYVQVVNSNNDTFAIEPWCGTGEVPLETGYYTYRLYYYIETSDSINFDTTFLMSLQVD